MARHYTNRNKLLQATSVLDEKKRLKLPVNYFFANKISEYTNDPPLIMR